MFYIFNKNGKCVGSCNAEPCRDDLASRGEQVMEFSEECQLGWELDGNGTPRAPVVPLPTPEQMTEKARQLRNGLLAQFDRKLYRNQFFWSTLTTEQQSERLAYRQALLDVPQQVGFPVDIAWPDQPIL